MTELYRTNCKV